MVAFPDMGRTNGHKGAPRHGAAGRKPPRTPRSHARDFLYRKIAADLRANMGAAAHLIHGSSDGRFSITYCVREISREEVEGVGFKAASYDEMSAKYDPTKLKYGYNVVDGEEIYFIPNPALGLWINREKFNEQKGA